MRIVRVPGKYEWAYPANGRPFKLFRVVRIDTDAAPKQKQLWPGRIFAMLREATEATRA